MKDATGQWKQAITNVLKAAEKMPAEKYDYRATPEVRTFGGFVGHIADATVMFCAAAAGEKKTPAGAEKTMKTKDALVASLKDSIAYCDKVYGGLTGRIGSGIGEVFRAGPDARGHPVFQQHARLRALREPGDLHAVERFGAAVERRPVVSRAVGRACSSPVNGGKAK